VNDGAPLCAGSVAIVAGGSRGIGRAVAAALVEHGARVVVNGRDGAVAEATATELGQGAAVGVGGSAADPAVAEALVSTALASFGRVDMLVNCAGFGEPEGSSILNVSDTVWRDQLGVHLDATLATCRAVAPHFVEQRGGTIVNTGSFAFTGMYGGTGYPAGKGGVNSLTAAIAADLAEFGVRANVVCPGAETRLSRDPAVLRQLAELRRRGVLDELSYDASLDPGAPEYVAPMYVFLASPLSAGISGEVFAAAGGFVGRYPRPEPALLGWRDHHDHPPWTVDEIAALVRGDQP
jgi:NAD(P)-dependent dehydrogenase (short-subunit alcohol dehydrogenase family)